MVLEKLKASVIRSVDGVHWAAWPCSVCGATIESEPSRFQGLAHTEAWCRRFMKSKCVRCAAPKPTVKTIGPRGRRRKKGRR